MGDIIKISEVAQQIRGVSYSPSDVGDQRNGFVPILRATNITASGIDLNDLVWISEKVVSDQQYLKKDDIIVAASSGSKSVIGKAARLDTDWHGSFGAFCKVIRPNGNLIDPKYLHYYFQTADYRNIISHYATGANINNLRNEHLANLIIPCPSRKTQKKIVSILDEAYQLHQKDLNLMELFDDLSQSVFYELLEKAGFLDNDHQSVSLSDISEVVSGVTVNAKNNLPRWKEYNYLRVANVQDGHLDLTEVKKIKTSEGEFKKYKLEKNDIILTEGGDPDKLGRGTLWMDEVKDCIHQNHIFRVRITSKEFNPFFVSYLIGSKYGKRYFLKAAKQTTGIASINSTQLKAFPVSKAPIKLQNKFQRVIEKWATLVKTTEKNAEQSNDLFQSLLQSAFKGELV